MAEENSTKLKRKRTNKGPSGYVLFLLEHRKKVVEEHPDLPLPDVTRIVAAQWSALPDHDRQIYNKEAERIRKENELAPAALNHGKEDKEIIGSSQGQNNTKSSLEPKGKRPRSIRPPIRFEDPLPDVLSSSSTPSLHVSSRSLTMPQPPRPVPKSRLAMAQHGPPAAILPPHPPLFSPTFLDAHKSTKLDLVRLGSSCNRAENDVLELLLLNERLEKKSRDLDNEIASAQESFEKTQHEVAHVEDAILKAISHLTLPDSTLTPSRENLGVYLSKLMDLRHIASFNDLNMMLRDIFRGIEFS